MSWASPGFFPVSFFPDAFFPSKFLPDLVTTIDIETIYDMSISVDVDSDLSLLTYAPVTSLVSTLIDESPLSTFDVIEMRSTLDTVDVESVIKQVATSDDVS